MWLGKSFQAAQFNQKRATSSSKVTIINAPINLA
jgi:hypothetical protein